LVTNIQQVVLERISVLYAFIKTGYLSLQRIES